MATQYFNSQIKLTYRSSFQELTLLCTVEPNLETRPLVLLFLVDASHSMRFFIDEAKTIQRQTLVQTALSIAINNPQTIKDSDYVGITLFSTDVKDLLTPVFIEISPESREQLKNIIIESLKSDGGKTNYAKAFEHTLMLLKNIQDTLPQNSLHLTGPMLVWFLTDGRPWPKEGFNTEEGILALAQEIGTHGHEIWAIGISQEANQALLQKITLANQQGAGAFQESLLDVPKELIQQQLAEQQTLWLDITPETHERLVFGLVNAIESARTNLGIVVEITLSFVSDYPLMLDFLTGTTQIQTDGQITTVVLKRPIPLRIGQKLSIAFSLKATPPILHHVRLFKIQYHYYRGNLLLFRTQQLIDQPLMLLINVDQSEAYGQNQVRKKYQQLRTQFLSYFNQIQDVIDSFSVLNPENTELTTEFGHLRQLVTQHKGLTALTEDERSND